jgi:hypothetical protein
MKIGTVVFCGVLFCTVACNTKERLLNKVDKAFKSSLKLVNGQEPKDSSIYVIIPRAGCSGCISSAESYMLNHLKDSTITKSRNKVTFILTNFDSEKILRARFGDAMTNQQILIDKNNVFSVNLSLKSIYPLVLFFDKNADLAIVKEVSPHEDGLAKLSKELKARNRKG